MTKIILSPNSEGRYVDAGFSNKAQELTEETMKKVSTAIGDLSNQFWDSFSPNKSPKEVKIEFGISVDSNTDIVVVKSTVEANFKVTLLWGQDKSE